jgi:hypothetical protein
MLISTALLLDSIIRNSVCTPAKLPCRRVEVGYEILETANLINLFFCSTLSEFENFLLCERILMNLTTCQNETSS